MSCNGAREAVRGEQRTVKGRQRRLRRRRTQPTVTTLEDRWLLSTFTVTNTADSGTGSLRNEIGLANSTAGANVVDFSSTVFNTPLTITLTGGQLELNNKIGTETITGPAAGVTVSGGGTNRVFQVDNGVTATLSGLTISGGSTTGNGGGLYNNGGTATLTNCTVSGNSAGTNGGGLYSGAYGATTLTYCAVSGNSADGNGGGLFNSGGTTALSYCSVSGNSAAQVGGGLYNSFGTTALTDCTVSGNSAGANGGGLYDLVGTTTMAYDTFSGNSASVSGGGFFDFFGTGMLSTCTFSGNSASVNGGGLYGNGSTTELTNCSFSGNSASVNGGGLYNNGGTAYLTYGGFSGNSAGYEGGGVDTVNGTTGLTNVTVSGNSAAHGGGLANSGGTTALTTCIVSGNSAVHGGGLYNLSGTTVLNSVMVSGNVALSGAGLSTNDGTSTLTNSTVTGNTASSGGGGVLNDLGTTTLSNCSVDGNYATSSGGVGTYDHGTTTLLNSSVSGNSATENGGGLNTEYNSTTTLLDCSVSGNSASGSGGGVATEYNSTTTLLDSSVSGNTATRNGGGLDTENDSTTALTNCTVSGNSAGGNGGGMYTTSGGTAKPTDVTVSGNSAGGSGGGLYNGDGTVTLGNTIVAANTAATSGPDADGTFASLGTNLVGETNDSLGWVSSDLTGTSAQPLNPLLAPLGNYGGPTQTMPLLPGSLAIDTGNNAIIPSGVITDQRGLPRIVNGVVDIGAFESSGFTIAVTSGSGQSTPVFTAFPAPLVATVTANNPIEPVAGGQVTFTPPQSGASATLGGNPATINANDEVSVTAAANAIGGNYTVVAGGHGIWNTASFSLTNKWVPLFSVASQTIVYGTPTTTLIGHLGSGTAYPTGSTVSITLNSVTQTSTVNSSGNFTTSYNTASLAVAAGPYTVTYAFAGNSAFVAATDSSTQVTVIPAPLTIAANDVSRVYGASDPTLSVSYSGFVNGETSSVLGGTLSVVDSDAAATTAVGAYTGVITASGQTSTNYTITYVAGNLTVTPAPLTITATGVSRVYGGSDPTLGVTYSGFVNGETSGVLGGTSSIVDSDAATTTAVGAYTGVITASGQTSTNYTITDVAGTLRVTPAPLTITANCVTRVYGVSDPTLGVTYSGFVNGETSGVLGGTLSVVDSDAATTTTVGAYTGVITASGQTSTNYTITYVTGNLTVTPAALTITADSMTKTYGQTLPFAGTEFTTSGLINSDSVASVSLSSTGAAATATVAGSPYVITASGAVGSGLGNYTISYVNGALTVNAAPLTITADSMTKTYGQTVAFAGTEFTTSGLVNSDSVASVSLSSTGAAATATVNGSPYAIIASSAVGSGLGNYTISYVNGALTVNAAPLTITANSMTKTYGQTVTFLGTAFTTSGLVNSDSVASVSLSSAGAAATAAVNGSPYAIIATNAVGSGLGNYAISYVNGALTVNAAPLTVIANSMTKTYGQTVTFPGTAFTTSGLLNSDSVASVSLSSAGAAATAPVAGSPYAIIASNAVGSGLGNYTISYVNGSLTVNTAPLTITANSTTKTYGQTVTFAGTAFSTSGLLNGDSVASVSLSSTGAAGTAAVNGSPYVIIASSAVGSGLGNYTISYVNGALTVNTAPLTITADSTTKTYGQTVTFPGTAFTTSGLVNSDSVASVSLSSTGAAATAAVNGSPYAIIASNAVGSGLGNYTINYVNGALTVNAAPLTITANSMTKTYGQTVAFAGTEFTTSGLVNSDSVASATLSSTGAAATATVNGSPYAIIASSAVGSGLGNYTITYVNGTLTVNKANPTIATTPSMTTVALGTSSVTLNDTAVLSGGYNETGTITFTLYLGSTLENTETVTTTGNGSYTTPTGYTLPTSGTVTGTYQWDASYSGDSNNNAFSENNAANEQVVVSPASPAITTTPNVTTVVLRSPASLKDTAVLSGGYSPTGTITFTLVAPGGGAVDTETVAINGNGTYTTPTGYTLPTTSTLTGVYQWDAVYTSANGDNNAFSDYNATNEQVTVTIPPNVTVTKTADQATIIAGQTAGFVVTITNNGPVAATGVTLSDPLPAGAGDDVTWTIDTTENTGNFVPGDFTISGTAPNQALTLASTFNDKLAVGQTIAIHITGVTTANDTTSTNPALNVGGLANYTVLYEGTGTNQLSISNDTVGGNIGVAGGQVQFSGPGTINGRLDFSSANTGQYQSTNTSNVGPTSINYHVSALTTAINAVNSLSTALGALPGTSISFNNSNQTVNESSGMLETNGGLSYRVFNVTSYSENNSDTVTINGDGSGDPVVFNFAYIGNTNLGGQVALTGGLTDDQVMWNFKSSNQNVQLSNNGETYAGVIILPNDNFTSDNYNLDGRVYGGADGNMQIVSGANVYAPITTGTLPNTATVSATGDIGQPGEQASATVTVVSSVSPCCNLTGITYSVYNPSTGITTTPTDLSGNTQQGDTVTVTFTVPAGNYDQISLVSYNAPEGFYNTDDANLQTVFQSVTQVESPGTHTLSVTLPNNFYQVDLVCGTVITTLGPTATNPNNFYHAQNRYIDGDNAGVNPTGSGVLSVTGEVYNDLNFDRKLDSGDSGLANVTVTLAGTDLYGNSISETTTTNGSGLYTFSGMPFSNSAGYSVSVTPPSGYSASAATVGAVNSQADGTATTSPEGVQSIVLAGSTQTTGTGYNLGLTKSVPVAAGEFATIGFWRNSNGQAVIKSFNGSSTATGLGNWLAATFPNLFGSTKDPVGNLTGETNSQIASLYAGLPNNGVTNNDYIQTFAVALGIYADTTSLSGASTLATKYGFTVSSAGFGTATYNVGSNGAAFGVANNTSLTVLSVVQTINSNYSPTTGTCYGGSSTLGSDANNVLNGINTTGDVASDVALSAPAGSEAYTPAQIRAAYGISSLSLDGSGQTIAIVDAYDDPDIFQAVDAFDTQFGLTGSGPTLANQYGPASSFLTVLNQNGQSTSLPATDPSGAGTDNWEVEESLDVEWAHAIAPGAQIVLVEANSQSLSDLMTGVATATSRPGVSVVSMSWGFAEGQAVFAADEAAYDSSFDVPGVTFVAGTGDYGAADPEYPAFSPNVVAVGGTSLNLNADNSYNSETGWGYQSDSVGAFIGSGGGISMYEPEPAYQMAVQSTGMRTTPDVSLVADPATGAWVADPYNLGADNPFEVVGGTSLSAPAWAGLVALVNQGRAAAGEASLDSSSPTETQQALYSLPQSDYNMITSGSNGYSANAGYNLVTGLGTPVANLLVGDLVAYHGTGTTYSGPTVGALQDATLVNTGPSGGSTDMVFSVFSALTVSSSAPRDGQGPGAASTNSTPTFVTSAHNAAVSQTVAMPVTTLGTNLGLAPGSLSQSGPVQAHGWATDSSPLGQTSQSSAAVTITAVPTSLGTHESAWSTAQADASSPANLGIPGGSSAVDREVLDVIIASRPRTGPVSDAVLDELAADKVLWPAQQWSGTITIPALPTNGVAGDPVIGDPLSLRYQSLPPTDSSAAGLAVLGLAAGLWARGAGIMDSRKRQPGHPFSRRKSL